MMSGCIEYSMNRHTQTSTYGEHTLKNACNEDIKPYEIVAPPAEIVYGPLPEFGTFCDVHYSVAVALKRDHVPTVMYMSQRKYSFFLPSLLSFLCQACNGSNNPYSRNALFTVNCGKRNAGDTEMNICRIVYLRQSFNVGKVIERVCSVYIYVQARCFYLNEEKGNGFHLFVGGFV